MSQQCALNICNICVKLHFNREPDCHVTNLKEKLFYSHSSKNAQTFKAFSLSILCFKDLGNRKFPL